MQGVVLGDVVFNPSAQGVQDSFEAVDFLLEIMDVGDPKPWFPPFLVHTHAVVTGTPSARRFRPVAFDLQEWVSIIIAQELEKLYLPGLTQLAPVGVVSKLIPVP